MTTKLDNTMISCYKECPRKFYLRHKMNLTPITTASYFSFGRGWHAAMDEIWSMAAQADDPALVKIAFSEFMKTVSADKTNIPMSNPDGFLGGALTVADGEDERRTPQTALRMIEGYMQERRQMLKTMTLIGVETPFEVPLTKDGQISYVGRMDKVFSLPGHPLIIGEHKTSTLYSIKQGFQPRFVEAFSIASQIDGYLYGAWLTYENSESVTVWVDAALVHKNHTAFKIIPIQKGKILLEEWLTDARMWADKLLSDCVYARNTNACYGFSVCSYVDICRFLPKPSLDDETPAGFERKKWDPQLGELPIEGV